MIGTCIGVGVTGSVGVVCVVIGLLIWKKEMIRLLYEQHTARVSPEGRKAFCRLSGIGVLLIGVGLIATAILFGITDSAWSFLCFAAGFGAGILLLITAEKKYNPT